MLSRKNETKRIYLNFNGTSVSHRILSTPVVYWNYQKVFGIYLDGILLYAYYFGTIYARRKLDPTSIGPILLGPFLQRDAPRVTNLNNIRNDLKRATDKLYFFFYCSRQ